MTKAIKLFRYESSDVRTLSIDGEPYFVASDVAKILGLTNTTVALSRLDPDERSKFNLGRQGEVNIVNEFGLYELILESRKPKAHDFKRWITHEVIPAIRKNGFYMTDQEARKIVTDKNALADFMQHAGMQMEQAGQQLKAKDIQIEEMKPKALFADSVSASHGTILIGELAKILKGNGINMGERRLFLWLRKHGYLIARRGTDWNMPTQYSMNLGLFEIKETVINRSSGRPLVKPTTKVTGKGQQYFVNKFLKERENKIVKVDFDRED